MCHRIHDFRDQQAPLVPKVTEHLRSHCNSFETFFLTFCADESYSFDKLCGGLIFREFSVTCEVRQCGSHRPQRGFELALIAVYPGDILPSLAAKVVDCRAWILIFEQRHSNAQSELIQNSTARRVGLLDSLRIPNQLQHHPRRPPPLRNLDVVDRPAARHQLAHDRAGDLPLLRDLFHHREKLLASLQSGIHFRSFP